MPRRVVTVSGLVQGVGFRPFVTVLARRVGLAGFVRNQGGVVVIEVEGEDSALDCFLGELCQHVPPLARVGDVSWISKAEQGGLGFTIQPSLMSAVEPVSIAPDIATCDRCLKELFDPTDRRFGYALLNCTHCGPRLTIVTAAPYDRPRTTMKAFAMCPACRQEYEEPTDRRFHAQPIACPECGPQLIALDSRGLRINTDCPIEYAAKALVSGRIGALKGIGGFHLACHARSESAVWELRQRKHRDAKPLAIMVRDVAAVRRVCEVSAQEAALLSSPARPIVLLRRRPGAVAVEVAPRNPCLGVMLPYTPLHHLLLQAVGDTPLVMTSGNWSDEPIAYEDQDALERLSGLADFFVIHNRPIHLRCDDSVVRSVGGHPLPLRRSRGYGPLPIPIPVRCPRPILALGGQLKSTFALGRDQQAVLSHHLGDLNDFTAYRGYEQVIAHYERLFSIEPELIVHDLHPDYATTRYALERSRPVARLAVQHHHAHLASCLAEHGLDEPVIGVIFDGAGFGADGAVWGGEFLVGDYCGYRRAAHLRYVPMPGGEQAIRETWRMALAHLVDAGIECNRPAWDVPQKTIATVRRMITRRFNAPMTSSAGRLFDTVAVLAGLQSSVDYEGQAAMELEWLATDTPADDTYPFSVLPPANASTQQLPLEIDTRPLISAVVDDVSSGCATALIARRFHSTIVEIIVKVCKNIGQQQGLDAVALSGGVFMNALLLGEVVPRLEQQGFRVYRHQLVPPNDGGLCLGQLVIAAARQNRDNSATILSGFSGSCLS
jgi:hydrogenase maturation protein HypF